MAESLQAQVDALHHSMTVLEGQRATLGDAVVEPAIAALRQQLAALEAQVPAVSAPAEERRLITILFTDVVGSTGLAESLDPEEWRRTVARLHGMVGEIVQKHQGTVAQYLGDGLLALFGAQASSEHDPENAIRAGLEALSAVSTLNGARPIQIRVGIHTGLVVMGELGSEAKKEFTATGDAMNLAARLQAAAPPGGMLVSHDTYRYVRGVFDVTPQPALTVKGRQELVQTYLVRAAKPRPFRTVARGVVGIETRTVGREVELRQLQAAYLDAFENRRTVWIQIVGEAGVGKSRLVEDTRDWIELRPETYRLLKARAFVGDAGQPFALIRRLWFDRFQIAEDAPLAYAETKWVQAFQDLAGSREVEPAHALGLLAGLPFSDSPHIGAMRDDPAQVKGRGFVVSRELLSAIRRQYPMVLLLEDLQWADASSWEYLAEVILSPEEPEQGRHGMFVLAAARPEWTPPRALTEYPHYAYIDLQPLSEEASRELAAELLQRVEGVPDEVVRLIVERSEGVPYFAEELVNWFVDRGIIDRSGEPWRFIAARLKESPLPATLQHLLLTRLSGLNDTERAVLQRGAIFGRNFWAGGLEALGVRQPDAMLRPLQPRGFVDPQPESSFEGETEWSFHHTLLRDVTYESVLRRERAALHRAAAGWLEEQARRAGRLDEFAGLLGEHVERAGELSAAADWYLRAGEWAKGRGAVSEAKTFFTRALDLLPPVDQERRWLALLKREEMLRILGKPQEWRADLDALLALANQIDDEDRRAEVHLRRAEYGWDTGDYRVTLQEAEEAAAAARRADNPLIEVRAIARKARAQTRFGDVGVAVAAMERALARARDLGDEPTLMFMLRTAAGTFNETGDPARAAHLRQQGIDLASRLGDRRVEADSLGDLGFAYLALGLFKMGRAALEQALQLAEAAGHRRGIAYDLQNLGLAYFRGGDGRAARQTLERSLSELTAVGDTAGHAFSLRYLGLVLEHAGDPYGAARRFAEARAVLASSGVSGAMADSLAGLGRCALAQGQLEEARQLLYELWSYLHERGSKGMEFPVWAYLSCAEIFEALGEREEARQAVEAGYRELQERAEKISDPEWRKSYLENVPEHRAITEMWERSAPPVA